MPLVVASPGLAFVRGIKHFADVFEIFLEVVTMNVVSLQPIHDILQPGRSQHTHTYTQTHTHRY